MTTEPIPRPHGVDPTGSVARPRRRRLGPAVALLAATAVPATGLFALFSWADSVAAEQADQPLVSSPVDAPTAEPGLSTTVMAFRRLAPTIARDLNASAFANQVDPVLASIGDRSCAAVSVDGEEVGSRNAGAPVLPASTQKIPVAAVALERLGGNFRYTTSVVASSEPVGGVIEGDLVLVGGGDPLLSSDWYPESGLELNPVTSHTSLDTLADRVIAAGVSDVRGSVVGDGSRYDDEFYAPGWGAGVAGLEAGPYDALLVNDSRVLDDPMRGADPNESAAREFTRLLAARGVAVAEPAVSGAAPPDAVEIAAIESAPMSDVVAEMLTNSDNNTAELVVKELGTLDGEPGTRDAGLAVVLEQFVDWDIDVSSIVLADGSGLSLGNRLTCDALLTVLQRTGFTSPIGQGLPVAGQTGTLRDIFTDDPVAGRLRGKTGTLNNPPFNLDPPAVKALAGFLPVEGGSAVEYVLVLNGPTISDQREYRPVWADLVDALDTYPSGVSPLDLGPR